MLWQTDATPYEWLGAETEKFALHAVIDDATSIVVGALFTEHECALGYTQLRKIRDHFQPLETLKKGGKI
jgi:hypothetical protein